VGKTLLEALKEKNLVDAKKAEAEEAKRQAALKREENESEWAARSRGYADEEARIKDERYHKQAAKEGRNSASRVGSKQYFDRFKK